MTTTSPVPSDVLFLADSLVLDFINSEYGVADQHHDCLTDDESVLSWLKMAGQLPQAFDEEAPQGLLALARKLREHARAVIHTAMAGGPPDLEVVNQVLESGDPIREIRWDGESRAFRIVTRLRHNSPACLLEPVVSSLASLLTSDKFEFVRQCEAHDCILLFHDLTKSHRRRWCSMATCGNRMKVAAFRSRKKTE
jgi:predicted RNA-binding Zn ribbon-like protein